MAITRQKVRLRRWLVAIGLTLTVLLGSAVAVVRVEFEGPDLAETVCDILNSHMRGRVAIASIEWPIGALTTIATGGWVPVTVRGLEVWDGRGADAESVVRSPLVTAELDLHSIMIGRHDFVFRNVRVSSGRVVLREVTEPYPLHDYDSTVFSLIAAFYGERSAGFRAGVFAASSPRWDVRDFTLDDVELEVRTKPIGDQGNSYLFRANVKDIASTGFLYMDPSDPLVPKFYFSLAPKGGRGQVDLYYDKTADGQWPRKGLYSFPVERVDVTRLAQLPSGWPSDPVANSLAFDLSVLSRDEAKIRVRGAMIDYWDTPYGGTWDVNLSIEDGGQLVSRSIDPDAGGEHVRLEAQVSGPIVFYPSVAIKAAGLTYKIRALTPPLELALDTLTGVYDLAVDEGSIDEFIARGTGDVGGEVRISAKFGGDGSDRSPFWVDSNIDINTPIDMASYLPPTLARAVGTRLHGRFHALRRKGDTAYGVSVDEIELSLGRLRVDAGQIYVDKSLDKLLLDHVRVAMPGFTGKVRCTVYTGTEQLRFDQDDCEAAIEVGDVQELLRAFSTSPAPRRAPRATPQPPAKTPRPRRGGLRLRHPRSRSIRHAQAASAATRNPAPATPPRAPARNTSSVGTVKIRGNLSDPQIDANLTFDDIPLLGSLRGRFRYQGDSVVIEEATSTSLGGRVKIRGPVRLKPTVHLDGVRVEASGIDLARVGTARLLTGKGSTQLVLRGAPNLKQLVVSGWACSNRLVALGDTLTDVGVWLNRAPEKLACTAVVPPKRTPTVDACVRIGAAGGRCAVARAKREAGGELRVIASADRNQRLGGELQLDAMPLPALLALAGVKLPVGAVIDSSGVRLGGTLDAPTVDGVIRLTRAWFGGGYLGDGEVALQTVGSGLVRLTASFLDSRLKLTGTIATRAPYAADLVAEFSHVEVDTFISAKQLGLPEDTYAWISGRGAMSTQLGTPNAPWNISLDLREMSITATLPGPGDNPIPFSLRAAAPIALVFDGTTARLVHAAQLETPLGLIVVEGSASLAQLDLSATGKLGLASAQPLGARMFDQMRGAIAMTARLGGSALKPHVQVVLDLERIELDLARQDAILSIPGGRIDLTDGNLSFTGVSVAVKGGAAETGSALTVAGGITLDGLTPTHWAVIISGALPGEMLLAFAPQVFSQASGTANLQISLSGQGATPWVTGEVAFGHSRPADDTDRSGLNLLLRAIRRELIFDAGTISFSGDRAASLEFELAGVSGTIDHVGRLSSVDGTFELRGGRVSAASVTASAQGLPFRLQRTLDLVLDIDAASVELEDGALSVGGQIKIVSGRFTRNFDLGEFLTPSGSTEVATVPFWESSPTLAEAHLDLAIETRKFAVANNLANVEMEGNVTVSGTPKDPRFEGEIRVSRGTFRIPGMRARFTRTSGNVTFEPTQRFPAATPALNIRSEADYRDPSGQDHLVTLTIQGNLTRPSWDLTTASGFNKAQTLVLIVSGRAPDDVRRSLGDQSFSDPTRIDPSTSGSQGYADELLKDVASTQLEKWVGDTLRDISGLDVARIELNFGSFGFHAEKRLLENVGLIGNLERTDRGSTASGRLELRLPPQTFGHFWGLRWIPGWQRGHANITSLAGEARLLSKNYDDAAERDINDLELKAVIRVLLAR